MTVVSPERVRDDLMRAVHRASGLREFTRDASRILRRGVPFDGVCLVTMDPATLLPTGEVVENGLPPATRARMAEIEIRGEDVLAFGALARSPTPAASLSEATDGDLDRSLRHRELKRPHGFGDELRAALSDDWATWGGLALLRADDRGPFEASDAVLLATVSPILAEGIRRTMLLDRVSSRDEPVGLAVLAPDDSLTLVNAEAEAWLAELGRPGPGEALPTVVRAVATAARGIAEGRLAADRLARARVRTESGRWLVVRGSTLGDDDSLTAVIFEPAGAHELAPLIANAYALTDRERTVTQLVAHGLPTDAIAARLHLSPWTVQDHLKSIFEKTGVGSRGELVARLFFDHYAPRLS